MSEYDLMFEKSGDGHWTSRNNNYTVAKQAPRVYSVRYLGELVHTAPSKAKAFGWANNDQARRLGL